MNDSKKTAIKVITENKKARFDYAIGDIFEAGIELTGSEVKSVRRGDVQLKDSYVIFKGSQAFLQSARIAVNMASSYNNHEPERLRRLLLNKNEISKIDRAISEKGFTCVPLRMYFKANWAKVEIALVKGKNAGDKRASIKGKEADRELAQAKRTHR